MTGPTVSSGRTDQRITWALVLFLLAAYLLTSAVRFHSIDELAVFGVTRSLFGHGGIATDILYWRVAELGKGTVVVPGADGHYYSIKDLLPSLLGLPLVWLARTFQASPVRVVTLLGPLVTALTGGLLYRLMRWWRYRQPVALLIALVFGLATLAWPYAETFFTQSFAALGLTLALYGTARAAGEERPVMALMAGLGFGLAMGSALPTAVTLPVYPVVMVFLLIRTAGGSRAGLRRVLRLWLAFGLGLGVILLLLGYYNWLRFGDPLQTAYQQGGALARFSWRYIPTALYGLLLSTPRGLLWYVPLALLAPAGVRVGWRQGRRAQLGLPLGQLAMFVGFLAMYDEWWGGLAWGPRLLVPVMPALAITVGPLLEFVARRPQWVARLITTLVVLVSFLTQLLSSLTENVRHAEGLLFPLLKAITPPTDGHLVPSVLLHFRWVPQIRLLGLVDRGEWDTLWLVGDRPDLVLFVVLFGCVLAALVWLLAEMRGRSVGGALVCQAVLSVALMAWMGVRYPFSPATFQNEAGFRPAELDHLAATIMSVADPGDGVVVLLPYGYLQWIDAFIPTAPDYGVQLENPLTPATTRFLETATRDHDRLWLVSEIAPYDPNDGVEPWLAEHGFAGKSTWFGEYRLESFTISGSEILLDHSRHTFGHQQILLLGHAVEQGREWLNVWLRWQALADGDVDYTVTVQVLDTAGFLVAQHDGIPGGGFAPTSAWSAGQIVDDRHSVALPADLSPGSYRLAVAFYGLDGVRLPVSGEPDDAAELTTLDLVPAE